jgi:hypothetical protein
LIAPPIRAVELIVADFDGVYINTASGTTYRSAPAMEAGWVQAELPKSKSSIVANHKPCNLTSPEFSLFASPPTSVADCLQTIIPAADGAAYVTYTLEPDGTLWKWVHAGNGYSALALAIGVSAFGAFLGLLVGVIWSSR